MSWKELEVDALLALVFSVSTMYSLEILTGTVYGVTLTNPIVQEPVTITIASALSWGSLAVLWFFNQPSIDRLDFEEKALVGATLGLMGAFVLAPILAPGLLTPIYSDYLIATVALMLEGGGFWTIATA